MKKSNKGIWVGDAQFNDNKAFRKQATEEFFELPVVDVLADDKAAETPASRRDFLKYMGFGISAATVAASCDIPVRQAVPYVHKPDDIVPGVATYYATSFVQGGDYLPVLVKCREGRPIKIEGNGLSEMTNGGTSARAQASVLGLYDTSRYQQCGMVSEDNTWSKETWEALDARLVQTFSDAGQIRIVSHTILSPTAKRVIGEFVARYPNTRVVTYDPVSSSALLQANQQSFGQAVVPNYRFDLARVIVSFNADFLGTWISPVEYAKDYIKNRIVDADNPRMSHHVQVESHMSLTGSNADNRILVKPSEMGVAIAALHNAVAGKTGGRSVAADAVNPRAAAQLSALADKLIAARGRSLVVSGSNNVAEQLLVNSINSMLGNIGQTVRFDRPSLQRQGIDRDIRTLVRELNEGSVDAVIVLDGANPAFDLPDATEFMAGLAKVPTRVSTSYVPNETSALCNYHAPSHHYLESWGDAEPKAGMLSIIQPTIRPIFRTRQQEESFLVWANSGNLPRDADQPYFEYLKANWEQTYFPQQNQFMTFQRFWDYTVQKGLFTSLRSGARAVPFNGAGVSSAGGQISRPSTTGTEMTFFETVNIGGGYYASNPWLQEMPDPVSRGVWGNFLQFPIKWDTGSGKFVGDGEFVDYNENELYAEADTNTVTINERSETFTTLRQFGLMPGTVATALGYGRVQAGAAGNANYQQIGTDVYPWMSIDGNGDTQYYATDVAFSEKGEVDAELAIVQYHHTMGVTGQTDEGNQFVDDIAVGTLMDGYQGAVTDRSVIFQAHINELPKFIEELQEFRAEAEHLNEKTLYPYEEYQTQVYGQGHHWGMHIDMNACIGCAACEIACVSENNVPVVGKQEVHRHHEMKWLRIDRYFYGDVENPNTVYQPMMCQHCDNAPCENVCPVAATNHSGEGLNQMTYNRCIGTRYCANNCPYKVRRFNWLDYTTADIFPANEYDLNGEEVPFGADNLTRMVLNPDVTVRSRGVIEKCSFCVQRIQEGKLTAKRELRPLRDGEIKTACQTACPTGAITFGDLNNKGSELVKKLESPLNYLVLEEINVRSAVTYSAKVINKDEALA